MNCYDTTMNTADDPGNAAAARKFGKSRFIT